jgi:hypothetical protein
MKPTGADDAAAADTGLDMSISLSAEEVSGCKVWYPTGILDPTDVWYGMGWDGMVHRIQVQKESVAGTS